MKVATKTIDATPKSKRNSSGKARCQIVYLLRTGEDPHENRGVNHEGI